MKKVVILGGGYGGVAVLRELKNLKDVEIILIDQNPYQFLQPEVYNFIANKYLISDVTIDLFSLSIGIGENISFVKAKVMGIDFDRNLVITEDVEVQYDYLVFSLGSRTFFPPIKGLRENSSGVKTLIRSMNFKHQFEKKLLTNIKEEGYCPINKKGRFNIVVGGGGLSGVEIAAEMSAYSQNFFRRAGYLCEGVSITLIEAMPSILYGMHEFLIDISYKRLKELGVDIITGKKIVEVEKDMVVLDDRTQIYMDFLIWTGGIIASSLLPKLNLKINKKNQLIVDEFFRVENFDNIFAVGDCAETHDLDTGKILPPTAQIAMQSGKIVGNHIKSIILKKSLEKKSPKLKGIIAALGGNYGAGVIYDKFKVKGVVGYFLKESVFKSYKYPLKKVAKKGFNKLRVE